MFDAFGLTFCCKEEIQNDISRCEVSMTWFM